MQYQFQLLTITRNNVLKAIDGLTLEDLNTVPVGFKNNIIWNVAHLVVTQQLLCYKLSDTEMYIDNDFVDRYKKGTEVNFKINQAEVDYILQQLEELPKQLTNDYANSIFNNFSEYTTSYNVTLNSIEDAITFNNVHEGLHYGYILAMIKSL